MTGRAKPTASQLSLARLVAVYDMRSISRRDAMQDGLLADLDRARKAGLIQSANYETSVAAEDWLAGAEGRAALAAATRNRRGG